MNNTMQHGRLVDCTVCGLRQTLLPLEAGRNAYCSRCGQALEVHVARLAARSLAFSLGSLILLIPANFYPLLRFDFQGQWKENLLISGAVQLFQQNSPVVAGIVLLMSILAPVCLHVLIITASAMLLCGRIPVWSRRLWYWLFEMKEWGMVDVFLLGLGVGAIKLLDMGSVEFKPGIWFLLLFVLVSGVSMGALRPEKIWAELRLRSGEGGLPGSAAPGCAHCGTVGPAGICGTCGSDAKEAHGQGRGAVWAYLLAASILYFPANFLPVMTLTLIGDKSDYTVMGGIQYLWHEGNHLPAVIVFLGSMAVPIFKLAMLYTLLIYSRSGRRKLLQTKLFLLVKTMGRWSMVDIFVLAVLVSLGQMGVVATVDPQPGALAFCAVVLLTMVAANSFQSRWIWDAGDGPVPARPIEPNLSPAAP